MALIEPNFDTKHPGRQPKWVVYYVCPHYHRIIQNNYHHELFCKQCYKIYPKVKCQRRRSYTDGSGRDEVLREMPRVHPAKRNTYNRKYYLMRKFNIPRHKFVWRVGALCTLHHKQT
jgi:hypothetical protein